MCQVLLTYVISLLLTLVNATAAFFFFLLLSHVSSHSIKSLSRSSHAVAVLQEAENKELHRGGNRAAVLKGWRALQRDILIMWLFQNKMQPPGEGLKGLRLIKQVK